MVEVNNGAPFWFTLGTFTSSSSNWLHASYPLSGFDGQTLRCRFRFVSDPNTTAEGWYIDNFLCEPVQTAVEEPLVTGIRSPRLEMQKPGFPRGPDRLRGAGRTGRPAGRV